MKKSVLLGLALFGAIVMASCGGSKKTEEAPADNADFAASQPVASGEYRALSFEYEEPDAKRMPFDGRIIFSLDPANSGIYVYENGNRTHFKAVAVLSQPFAKADSVYTATDSKEKTVIVKQGAENDTLIIVKDDKPVKVAFERKALSEMSAIDAMTRISNMLSK